MNEKDKKRAELHERQNLALKSHKRIAREARLFQEAWLNHLGATRFIRFILTILIAFLASTTFVQSTQQNQCNRSKVFLIQYTKFVQAAKRARMVEAMRTHDSVLKREDLLTAQSYQAQIKLLEPGIMQKCSDVYPIIPLT